MTDGDDSNPADSGMEWKQMLRDSRRRKWKKTCGVSQKSRCMLRYTAILLRLQSVNNVFQIHLHSNERLSTRLQHLGTTPISEGGFTSVKAVIRWGLEECFAVKGWAGCNLYHRAVIYLRSVSISQLVTE